MLQKYKAVCEDCTRINYEKKNIGTQKRDVFMTFYSDETSIGIGPWFANGIKAKQGHIVIRVYPDGKYDVYVLDARKEDLIISEKFGPYVSE